MRYLVLAIWIIFGIVLPPVGIMLLFDYFLRRRRERVGRYEQLGTFEVLQEGKHEDKGVSSPKSSGKNRWILVVGGSGFVGSYIVKQLENRKANIIVLDASPTVPKDSSPTVTYLRGDVRIKEHLEKAMKFPEIVTRGVVKSVSSVMHVASILPGVGIPQKFMSDVNVQGLKNSLDAAKECGVNVFVYTSSATVVLGKYELVANDITEDHPYPSEHVDYYTVTKHQAEDLVRAAHNVSSGFRTSIVRPSGVFGIGDKIIADNRLRGKDPFYLNGPTKGMSMLDFVWVDDVARGHVLLEEALATGGLKNTPTCEVFHLTNQKATMYREFIGSENDSGTGLSIWATPVVSPAPLIIIHYLALANEIWAWVFGAPMMSATVSRMTVNFTQRSYSFVNKKAKDLLGWEPSYGGDAKEVVRKLAKEFRKSTK
eukprot:PhF_6_TR38984/c0_g1_i1/m.58338/K07748/E1.1.1.170, NSDHL, ERG26; sterol-4alpha-carboxylate 3-dehydrogenase (decarboxylating)